jgi:hypothetical protein
MNSNILRKNAVLFPCIITTPKIYGENSSIVSGLRCDNESQLSLAPGFEESYRETPFDENDEIVLCAWPGWNTESK